MCPASNQSSVPNSDVENSGAPEDKSERISSWAQFVFQALIAMEFQSSRLSQYSPRLIPRSRFLGNWYKTIVFRYGYQLARPRGRALNRSRWCATHAGSCAWVSR